MWQGTALHGAAAACCCCRLNRWRRYCYCQVCCPALSRPFCTCVPCTSPPPVGAGVHAPGCADGGECVRCLRLPLAHPRHRRPAGLARAQGCVPAAALPEQWRRLGVAGTAVSWGSQTAALQRGDPCRRGAALVMPWVAHCLPCRCSEPRGAAVGQAAAAHGGPVCSGARRPNSQLGEGARVARSGSSGAGRPLAAVQML